MRSAPQGLGVDRAGFDAAMAEQKARPPAPPGRVRQQGIGRRWFDIAEEHGSTEFIGLCRHEGEGQVIAIVKDGARTERAVAGDEVLILTNQTPLLRRARRPDRATPEMMRSDKGFAAAVEDTSKPLGRLTRIIAS
jgi:alanyl-tRNA synthetase